MTPDPVSAALSVLDAQMRILDELRKGLAACDHQRAALAVARLPQWTVRAIVNTAVNVLRSIEDRPLMYSAPAPELRNFTTLIMEPSVAADFEESIGHPAR